MQWTNKIFDLFSLLIPIRDDELNIFLNINNYWFRISVQIQMNHIIQKQNNWMFGRICEMHFKLLQWNSFIVNIHSN